MPKIGNVRRGTGADSLPLALEPYVAHGLDLQVVKDQATCDCPFCGRDGAKFAVDIETGQFNCFVCGVKGNSATFLRQLWTESEKATNDYSDLAADRKLVNEETLMFWGCCKSIIDGKWLVPGWGIGGKLDQLYLRTPVKDKQGKWIKKLLPTPGIDLQGNSHAIFGVNLFDNSKRDLHLLEGCWDAMAMWEAMRCTKVTEAGLRFTANPADSMLENANVIATPGANVFFEQWVPLLEDKRVFIHFDNDHPKKNQMTGNTAEGAGIAGVKRVARMLLGSKHPPKEVHFLQWGEEISHNPDLKSGWDVRDHLSSSEDLVGRVRLLETLLEKVKPIPEEWKVDLPKPGSKLLEPLPCNSWERLIDAWRKALRWRQGLDDVFSVMMAVAASTKQTGDQLFLQVIANAGNAKTSLCEGMLVSKTCHALEHLTGFHSGYNDGSGKDFSLLSRIDGKTLITPEGDVLMSSPHFDEIMSQQRRIFDGSSGASYKNSDEDKKYTGLRTPWIMAGTPALLDKDQSRLGDRFIRIRMDDPDSDERKKIMRRVAEAAWAAVGVTSNGTAEGQMDARIAEARRLTGGYVNWLKANMESLVENIETTNKEYVFDFCYLMGDFIADMRARPNPDIRKDSEGAKELPSRLTHQLVRLALCLTVTLNKTAVDDEVLRRIKRVAIDTGHGKVQDIVKHLANGGDDTGEGSATTSMLAIWCSMTEDKMRNLLTFLRLPQVDIVEVIGTSTKLGRIHIEMGDKSKRWRLTHRMKKLYNEVMEA